MAYLTDDEQRINSTLKPNQTLHVKPWQGRFDAYIETREASGTGRKGTYGKTPEQAIENLAAMLDGEVTFTDGTTAPLDRGIVQGEFPEPYARPGLAPSYGEIATISLIVLCLFALAIGAGR